MLIKKCHKNPPLVVFTRHVTEQESTIAVQMAMNTIIQRDHTEVLRRQHDGNNKAYPLAADLLQSLPKRTGNSFAF